LPYDIIRKPKTVAAGPPNLVDLDVARANFSWQQARKELNGLPGGGINIAYEAVDRHALGSRRDQVAIRWLGKKNSDQEKTKHDFSYEKLRQLSNQFANVLSRLSVDKGESVFVLTDRIPALYITALGALKNGSVFCPLFSAFGPEPIHARMSIGKAKVLVTTATIYKRKVQQLRERLPDLKHILIVDDSGKAVAEAGKDGVQDFNTLLNAASVEFSIVDTRDEDLALLHFTSGTTGKPKGAMHVHGAVLAHYITGKYALDLHPGDVFWCTADPGWVTGTSYGIIAPLVVGATLVVDQEEFDPERWYSILEQYRVTVWYTAPTAVRMMMKYGSEMPRQHNLSALRFIASVGEPLNPEAVLWGQQAFGLPIHDNWWQTETGGIMVANIASMDIKPGSMGKPLPGIDATIVQKQDDGTLLFVDKADAEGELALRRGWPSMFRGYLHEEERYRKCFVGDWYLSGDVAKRDADGYYWFVGRSDDVIKSSGHLIGPFEVESILLEHPAVAEAGVIGKPDPVAMEIVKAFVSLKPGYVASDKLVMELLAHARKRLGAAVAPREISILPQLPRTRSGKIMRRLLKARELGLPEGDTSTLEGGNT
jgi:acetyl-CoA synthetase